MIYFTRLHCGITQLRRTLSANKYLCVKVLLICILFYVLRVIVYKKSQLISNVNTGSVPSTSSTSGLVAKGRQFTLDGKPFTILSGAIHYFRVVPEYWEDRLLKLKALGLNTVETYVPWNLHEPTPGNFNFEGIANIKAYIKLAQKLGLFVIVRPGPYICAEWEFGGFPSWLLRDPQIKIRSFSSPYLRAVDNYFSNLFSLLVPLQYTKGGPIIAIQVENEYGNFGDSLSYMKYLHNLFTSLGISELLFTSDGPAAAKRALLPVLRTMNFQFNAKENIKGLRESQPDRPIMVMEFWPGWFDYWGEKHQVMKAENVVGTVRDILESGASINFYMFHGGTNFGFMNGANYEGAGYLPDITSYDYNSPISETGDITPKYLKLHKLLKELRPVLNTDTIPDQLNLPAETKKSSYGTVMMTHYIDFDNIVSLLGETIKSENVMSMEDLPINNNAGQSYGYTLYRTTVSSSAEVLNVKNLRDYGQIFLNGEAKGVVKWPQYNGDINIKSHVKTSKNRILDIFVENCGRVNSGRHIIGQKKGILGDVTVDIKLQKHWEIVPFEFKSNFVNKLARIDTIWLETSSEKVLSSQPAVFKGVFTVPRKPADTFLDMQGWIKGVAFINDHNLGRYWNIGPQETLYVPAPWLKEGKNTVLIFEQHPRSSSRSIKLVKEHRLGPTIERTAET